MIVIDSGSIFDSGCEGLVDPVNCLGTSGAGLALAFKKRFPAQETEFVAWCRRREAAIGRVFVAQLADGHPSAARWIYYLPTKNDWRMPSTEEYVRLGLEALAADLTERRVKSVAVPALGCGLGGLEWAPVRRMIGDILGGLDVQVVVYPPRGSS